MPQLKNADAVSTPAAGGMKTRFVQRERGKIIRAKDRQAIPGGAIAQLEPADGSADKPAAERGFSIFYQSAVHQRNPQFAVSALAILQNAPT